MSAIDTAGKPQAADGDPDYPEIEIRVVVRWEGCGFVTRRPPYYGQELTDEPSPLDKWDCEHFEVIGNEFDN